MCCVLLVFVNFCMRRLIVFVESSSSIGCFCFCRRFFRWIIVLFVVSVYVWNMWLSVFGVCMCMFLGMMMWVMCVIVCESLFGSAIRRAFALKMLNVLLFFWCGFVVYVCFMVCVLLIIVVKMSVRMSVGVGWRNFCDMVCWGVFRRRRIGVDLTLRFGELVFDCCGC